MQPARLLYPWDSSGKNTGVGCHALLQGIFLTQGLNLHLLSTCLGGEFFTTSTTWEALKMLTEDYRSAFWPRTVHLLILGAVLAPPGSVLESEGGAVASRVLWTECVPPHQI